LPFARVLDVILVTVTKPHSLAVIVPTNIACTRGRCRDDS
jgi:hypothetical protein